MERGLCDVQYLCIFSSAWKLCMLNFHTMFTFILTLCIGYSAVRMMEEMRVIENVK